jgi:hypothetical protein
MPFLRLPPSFFAPLAAVAALRLHRLDEGGGTKLPLPLGRSGAVLLPRLLLLPTLLRGLLLPQRMLALQLLLLPTPLFLDLSLRLQLLLALHALPDHLLVAACPFLLLQTELIQLLAALLQSLPALLLPHWRLPARDIDR